MSSIIGVPDVLHSQIKLNKIEEIKKNISFVWCTVENNIYAIIWLSDLIMFGITYIASVIIIEKTGSRRDCVVLVPLNVLDFMVWNQQVFVIAARLRTVYAYKIGDSVKNNFFDMHLLVSNFTKT